MAAQALFRLLCAFCLIPLGLPLKMCMPLPNLFFALILWQLQEEAQNSQPHGQPHASRALRLPPAGGAGASKPPSSGR